MNVLFIHQNFPAQYKHLAPALAARGHRVVSLAYNKKPAPVGVELEHYQYLRKMSRNIHPLIAEQEVKIIRAEAVAARCQQLVADGFEPEVVYVHPGWGEARFLREVFPQAKIVVYCEYYYNLTGQDVNFDPEFPAFSFGETCKLRLKNTDNLHTFQIGDAFVAPTQWQRMTYPVNFREQIQVIHEGVDFAGLSTAADAGLNLPEGAQLITYVSRNLEPMRGFHWFMRSLPAVLSTNPAAQVVIVGGDGSGYGMEEASGQGWRERMLSELGDTLDVARVHFLGKVEYGRYRSILAASDVHVYLTYPFVLSWSLLEAAALCKRLVVSDTAPLEEIELEQMRRVDFFDNAALSREILAALAQEAAAPGPLPAGLAAFELQRCLTAHLALFDELTAGTVK